ncbi:hypothetical protein K4043_03675 [Stenotrophomonas sp. SRS1]|uniref:hypothetical protein n=1 Tax=Stenotrophomonas sp. SRS1 TaxID=2870345 RepID=UPI002236F749|nr:hypothetical protein [Stenotrophomonas sp. SRS1]MCW6027107.1 hypothetical protein [Stenotrophomonas sp. SRS1]
MKREIAGEIFDVKIVDKNRDRTERVVSKKKPAFRVTVKPASASETRLGIATRAIHKQRDGREAVLKDSPLLTPGAKRDKPLI